MQLCFRSHVLFFCFCACVCVFLRVCACMFHKQMIRPGHCFTVCLLCFFMWHLQIPHVYCTFLQHPGIVMDEHTFQKPFGKCILPADAWCVKMDINNWFRACMSQTRSDSRAVALLGASTFRWRRCFSAFRPVCILQIGNNGITFKPCGFEQKQRPPWSSFRQNG